MGVFLQDGVGVRLGERVDVSWGGQTLMLTDARQDDTARYTCLATNIAGNNTRHYDLQVLREYLLLSFPPTTLLSRKKCVQYMSI